MNVLCGNTEKITLEGNPETRPASQGPDHSRLRREMGGEWRYLSGNLAVVREKRDVITGGRDRATAES